MMDRVSVIIPDRNGQPYLQKTVDDILAKAEGDIEIIVVADGIWPDPMLTDDKRVHILYHGSVHNNLGMREGINRGVAVSTGKYILKADEHTMWDQGFDTKLKADCDDNWVVIPRRKRLEPESWALIEDGRPPIDYMYLAYPYERPYDKTCGLHGAEWRERHFERKDVLVDDLMSWQGSAYFMTRKHWDRCIKELDTENYGTFTQEAQEIGNKTWLSGGRLVVNKKTWYAHFHKGKKGKGYGFSNEQYKRHMEGTEKGRVYCINYWLNTKEYQYDFEWLLQKFWPVPTWPENWKYTVEEDRMKDYSAQKYKPDWFENNGIT
jgi:hypothetical protein